MTNNKKNSHSKPYRDAKAEEIKRISWNDKKRKLLLTRLSGVFQSEQQESAAAPQKNRISEAARGIFFSFAFSSFFELLFIFVLS